MAGPAEGLVAGPAEGLVAGPAEGLVAGPAEGLVAGSSNRLITAEVGSIGVSLIISGEVVEAEEIEEIEEIDLSLGRVIGLSRPGDGVLAVLFLLSARLIEAMASLDKLGSLDNLGRTGGLDSLDKLGSLDDLGRIGGLDGLDILDKPTPKDIGGLGLGLSWAQGLGKVEIWEAPVIPCILALWVLIPCSPLQAVWQIGQLARPKGCN